MKSIFHISFFIFFLMSVTITAQEKTTFRGTVFLDENANGIFDTHEKGVNGVCISNGLEVVQTGKNGEWTLNADSEKSVFAIKPAGFAVPVNNNQVPLHFLSTANSSPAINFSLIKQEESKQFVALFFGDTQARGLNEVNYIFHDVVEELVGSDAAFGVSLGDIVADDPEMMDDVAAGIAFPPPRL